MKKKDFQKGAISVFLVIILIPCIVISGMFVDLSRVWLSKGVATSASDLALNSLMANYDKDLSQFYGLMASCQNIEQFYEESAHFFLEALYSQGLSADDAESLMTYIAGFFDEDQVHDLFQMEVETDVKDMVSDYNGASLGTSSVIIKDQIVEFMKYRAPVEITKDVITRLKDSGAKKTLEDAKKDEPLKTDKQEYAAAEEVFMKAAYKTYKAVLEYEALGLDTTELKTMLNELITARETYREITKLMVSNLNGTSGLEQFYRPTFKLNLFNYTEANTRVHSRKGKDESNNDVYYIDSAKINDLLKNLYNSIETFKTNRDNVHKKVGTTLVNASIGTGAQQYNAIQWWKKVDGLVESPISTMSNSARSMLDFYGRVIAIDKCTLDKDVSADWKTTYKYKDKNYEDLVQSVKDLQKIFLTSGVKEGDYGTSGNLYLRLVNKLEYHSSVNVSKTSPDTVYLKDGRSVTTAISDVNSKLSGYLTRLSNVVAALDKIIDGNIYGTPRSLTKVATLAKEYHSKFGDWRNSAFASTTDMGINDQNSILEIEGKEQDTDGGKVSVSEQDVLNFKTRLTDVRSRLVSVGETIESLKFGDKKVALIDSYNTAYNAVKNDIGENLTNSAVSAKAESLFKAKFTPYTSDTKAAVGSFNWSDNKYNPELTEAQPVFHDWMHKKFEKEDLESQVKKKEEEVNGKESEGNKKVEEAKNKDADRTNSTVSTTNLYNNAEMYAGADFPSGLDANGPFKLGSSLVSNIGTLVTSLVNMEFDGMRDALYSTEYVMDMFSYATYEYEGKYHLYKKKNNTAPKTVGDYDGVNEEWSSDKKTDTYNQTLTNVKINSDNNVLYGAEAEYVLYGKTNKENLTSAYIDIFEIRYVLNTLSGFQNFWSGNNTTSVMLGSAASSISALTSGIIPVPAVKCVLILLLTALETVNDLSRLTTGFPVELYKGEDDWVYAITDKNMGTGADSNKQLCEDGFFYSDYIYMFLCMGFNSVGEHGHPASEMYRRVGDLIQANMRVYTEKSDYKLKNARSYFTLNATIRVKPLMLALPVSQGYANNPKDSTDWCTFTVSDIRGYS